LLLYLCILHSQSGRTIAISELHHPSSYGCSNNSLANTSSKHNESESGKCLDHSCDLANCHSHNRQIASNSRLTNLTIHLPRRVQKRTSRNLTDHQITRVTWHLSFVGKGKLPRFHGSKKPNNPLTAMSLKKNESESGKSPDHLRDLANCHLCNREIASKFGLINLTTRNAESITHVFKTEFGQMTKTNCQSHQ
jgi:hypothetical protein